MKEKWHSDSELDDALRRDIEALFAVEPSREFVGRIRTRIAQAPTTSPWRSRWMIPAAGVAVAVIVLAVVTFRPQEVAAPETPKPEVTRALPESPWAVISNASRCDACDRPYSLRSATVGARYERPPMSVEAKPGKKEPEVLIAANEASAMRRLLNGGPIELPAGFTGFVEMKELHIAEIAVTPLAAPAPITIEPIQLSAQLSEKGVQ